ncbi:MAG TPA: inositol 2-dehydrogenase [Verrucomicrobiales bacterium]|nr:inositol 2-dehydrogenase [Verrucomicrobiales bacterium]HIL68471.1 inositol 2-dehydrogenase [Verrucomicrobiota bacterium]
MKFGLIGAGRIGRIHAQNLCRFLTDVHLKWVTDVFEASARDCAEELSIPEWGTDYTKMLNDPEIQAVVVCSSTDTHTQIIRAAADAGKHVFCEKPIDVDLSQIDQALQSVQQAQTILQIGFNRRFDVNFDRIHKAVASGEIGTPHQIHIISRDPGPPPIEYIRKSGGIFLDMMIHDFDMARFLTGHEIIEVYAVGSVQVDPEIGKAGDFDTATVLLKFDNGVTGVIENCRKAVYGYDQRVEVFGSKGCISADNRVPDQVTVRGSRNIHTTLPLHFFIERYQESYIEEMRRFAEAIRLQLPSPVSGEESRIPVVTAMAAQRSAMENRPVKLNEIA